MHSVTISGADHNWYNIEVTDPIRKYHKYFRQRDTLMAIPKILEDDLKNKDENKYNELVSNAQEERAKITFKDIIKTMPESAAIKKDDAG